jgi:glutaredoxin 3
VAFDDIDVTGDAELAEQMRKRTAGGTSTPQVFIRGQHVGGADELQDLEDRGALEWMIDGGESGMASPT